MLRRCPSYREDATASIMREEGASAVEFALVSIFLVTFVIGMAQFGVTFSQWLELEHAAREGVRWASLRNPEEVVKAQVHASTPGLEIADEDIVVDPDDPVGAPPNTVVTVSVAYDSPILAPLSQGFFGSEDGEWTIRLVATAAQRLE